MGLEVKRGLLLCAAAAAISRTAPAAERDLAEPGRLSLTVEKQPLSESLPLLEEKLGRPVVYLRGKSAEDDRILAKEITLRVESATLWDLLEEIARQTEVRLRGVGGRRIVLDREGAQPPGAVRYRPTIAGPFQLTPEENEPVRGQAFLRIRPEPWIGKPRLVRYKVSWTFHNEKTFVYDPKRIDSLALPEDEHLIPLAQAGSLRLAAARAVEVEAQLVLPAAWEAQTLPAVGKLRGKKVPVGKVEVTVQEARWINDSYVVEVQVDGHAVPSHALTLLDGKGERLGSDSQQIHARNGGIGVRLGFPRSKVKGDPKQFPLVLEVPTSEETHMLRARVAVAPLAPPAATGKSVSKKEGR
jgi:hypothetical protein